MSDSGRYIGQSADEALRRAALEARVIKLEKALREIREMCRPGGLMTGDLWAKCEDALKED